MKQYQIDRIKDLMEAKGITNQELASTCGISAMTIGRLLTKTGYNPTTDTVEKIAEALEVDVVNILEKERVCRANKPIDGFVEYGGVVTRIKTFRQLETLYKRIKQDVDKPSKLLSIDPQKGITVLSLFDGIGCAMQALKELGIKVNRYYASEVDKSAISIARKNHPNIIELGDVTQWRQWDIAWNEVSFIVAGSPCQGLTSAGKRLKFLDERSKLIHYFFQILEHTEKVKGCGVLFLLENVNMDAASKAYIDEALGVNSVNINSNLFSAQNRDRLYWTNLPIRELPKRNNEVLKDIIDENANNNPKLYLTKKHMDGLMRSYKWKPQTLEEKSKPILATYAKLPPHVPYVPYIDETKDDSRYSKYRILSGLECERLQKLPDGYTEYGEDGKQIPTPTRLKVLGNCFTVNVIKFILQGLDSSYI